MDSELTRQLIELVEEAGAAIMAVYQTDFEIETKADESPLTQADLAAHRIIEARLLELTPDIPLFSEESEPPDFEVRRAWNRYWLVDPLDGTKEFINRNGEFTVNIALIEDHLPVFGVVGVPVKGLVYVGDKSTGAYCLSASGKKILSGRVLEEATPLVVVASRSHGGERLEHYLDELKSVFGEVTRTPVGSSLKLCILAQGEADLYPRLGPTSEWDIAAAHAVLAAAGGEVWNVDGEPFEYNRKSSVLNPEFFAAADGGYPWRERLPPVPVE
ncbi:MAG: 3'(2'),5'-bisphosphate nucleotidase CysQ [Pseudomonadales bacterium]